MDNILAVLVLYKCGFEESNSFLTINESLKKYNKRMDLFVYDNSPSSLKNWEEQIKEMCFNVVYVSDTTNSGVSKAYNTAYEYAVKKNKQYLFLLDQDTAFPKNTVDILERHLQGNSINLFAPLLLDERHNILSPCLYTMGRGRYLKSHVFGKNLLARHNLLNSGLLVSMQAFKEVGGYDENIPLYFSDFNFILRFKKVYSEYYLLPMECVHSMSSNDYSDRERFRTRFRDYCYGASKCYSSKSEKLLMYINVNMRGLKIFLKTRDWKILQTSLFFILK